MMREADVCAEKKKPAKDLPSLGIAAIRCHFRFPTVGDQTDEKMDLLSHWQKPRELTAASILASPLTMWANRLPHKSH